MIQRSPNNKLIGAMKMFVAKGYNVVLYTSRDISRRLETEDWLLENKIHKLYHYHDIVFNKMKYDLIIDKDSISTRDEGEDTTYPDEIDHILDICM